MFSCSRPEKPASFRRMTVMARVASSPGATVLREFVHGLRQVAQRQPAIRREAVADLAGAGNGAIEGRDQSGRDRRLGVDAERLEIVAHVGEQRQFRIGRLGKPGVIGAQDAGGAFRALDVAAEPDQVLGRAARQAARQAARETFALAGQQRLEGDRAPGSPPRRRRPGRRAAWRARWCRRPGRRGRSRPASPSSRRPVRAR